METDNEDDALKGIMDYCEKHPNSKISNLILEVQNSNDTRHIGNLLAEISEKPEICVEFNIPLQYFLDKFLNISTEPNLSEAGCLILNAVKIYSRRVDYIHESVERHMTNLCSFDAELEKVKPVTSPEKIKRKPKRLLTQNVGAFETELVEKQFRVIPEEKRIKIQPESDLPPKRYFSDWVKFRKWETSRKIKARDDEDYLHPAMWNLTTIKDFEEDGVVDSIRNYRLFTYHIEHRYNTLVHDINFPMYFKVKDFLDEEDGNDIEESALDCQRYSSKENWPPLSDDYVNKYIDIENEILKREINSSNQNSGEIMHMSKRFKAQHENSNNILALNTCSSLNDTNRISETITSKDESSNIMDTSTKSTGSSEQNTFEESGIANEQTTLSETNSMEIIETDTQNGSLSDDSINNKMQDTLNVEEDMSLNEINENSEQNQVEIINEQNISDKIISEDNFDIAKIRVNLPHFRGKSVLYTDLDEIDFRMLNPIVQITKIFSSLTDILDIKITLDSQLKNILGVDEGFWNNEEPVEWNANNRKFTQNVTLNIFGLPKKRLKQKLIFKLPDSDFSLFKNDRIKQFTNQAQNTRSTKIKNASSKSTFVENYRNAHSPDFFGFAEANMFITSNDTFRKISMDSGICDNELTHSSFRHGCNNSTEYDEENNNSSDLPNNSCLQNYLLSSTPVNNAAIKENSNISKFNTDLNSTILNSEQNDGTLDRNLLSSTVLDENGVNSFVHENSSLNVESINENDITKDNQLDQNEEESRGFKNLTQESGFQSDTTESQSQATFDNNSDECNITTYNKQQPSYNLDSRQEEEIENWSLFLAPILVKTSDHFDVYDMGTDIINKFSTKEANPDPISFADVMEDKNPSHTARYFLSTLLLANQNNIKINVENYDCNKPSNISDLKLELNSRTRHTVTLEDDIGKSVPKRKIEKSDLSAIESIPVSTPAKIKKVATPEDADSGYISNDISVISNEEDSVNNL